MRDIKDDECGRKLYIGENINDHEGIFRFEVEDKG
jgi:hypothetical protein